MPKVTDEYRKARRWEISQAALRCFARKGFQATSMADIITESGLSAGAIYGHFKGKGELVSQSVGEILDHHLGVMGQRRNDGSLPGPREVITRFLAGLQQGKGDLGLIVQVWAEATTDPALRPAATRAIAGLRGIFEDYALAWLTRPEAVGVGDATGRARRYGALMLGVCQGFIVQSTLVDDFDAGEYLDALVALRLE